MDYPLLPLLQLLFIQYSIKVMLILSQKRMFSLQIGKTIIKQFRSSLKDNTNDIHAKLMSQYKEAPEWWYAILFVIAFTLAAIVCHFGKLMPWYFLFRKLN